MTICIFGDSITWGRGLLARMGWANLLRNELEKQKKFSLYDLGIDRDTSKNLLERFDVEARARKPDIIIFAIGTNDSVFRKTTDNPETPIKDFENNLQNLVQKAKQFTNAIIFVGLVKGDDRLTNPLADSTTGKSYSKENVKKYNDSIKNIALKNKLQFIDIYDDLNDMDFYDGLHPNESGHQKIFKKIIQYVK